MGFIYKITNNINGKAYIGLTTQTIPIRWAKHKNNANFIDYPLYRAMRKYGIENFDIKEIECVDNKKLSEREVYWIKYYNTYYDGYNATKGGEGWRQLDYEWVQSLWDTGYNITSIHQLTTYAKSSITNILKAYENYSLRESLDRRTESLKRAVCQFTISGDYIQTFSSEKEAAEAIGASNGSIGVCCNHVSGHKTVKDYIWLWEDEKEKIMDYVALLKTSRRSTKIMQQVEQLSLNGEHIAFYPTAKAAAQALGYKRDSHIGDCCKGRRNSCFGYKWKYVID